MHFIYCIIGAPGSFLARSRLIGGFDTGKLVQHCHFVPHEDHGLMAFHELVPKDEFPSDKIIVPTQKTQTPFSADTSGWYPATNCTEFSGASIIFAYAVNTQFFFYFKQFVYNDYCFFGFLPLVYLRPGHVDNAFLGFGFWGVNQNHWRRNVSMDGTALVYTLQASFNNTTAEYNSLHDIYTSEVILDSSTHTYEKIDTTPALCSDTPYYEETDPLTKQQLRGWYCVRPKTDDFPNTEFNPNDYSIDGEHSIPFGYPWAYGEGLYSAPVE